MCSLGPCAQSRGQRLPGSIQRANTCVPLHSLGVVVGDGELDLLSGVPVDGDVDRCGGGEFGQVRPRLDEVINGRTNRRVDLLPLAPVGVEISYLIELSPTLPTPPPLKAVDPSARVQSYGTENSTGMFALVTSKLTVFVLVGTVVVGANGRPPRCGDGV